MAHKPPNYEEALKRLKDPTTLTIDAPEAALLLGVSIPHGYQTIAETGLLAGLPVIRIGHRIKIPAAPLRLLLGLM